MLVQIEEITDVLLICLLGLLLFMIKESVINWNSGKEILPVSLIFFSLFIWEISSCLVFSCHVPFLDLFTVLEADYTVQIYPFGLLVHFYLLKFLFVVLLSYVGT